MLMGLGEGSSKSATNKLSSDLTARMLFFEKLFFILDTNGSDTITFEDAGRLLAFTVVDMTPEERAAALLAADVAGYANGVLDRSEFVHLCFTNMKNVPLEQLKMAADNFSRYNDLQQARISAKWRHIANHIDRYSRVIFPLSYTIAMIMVFFVRFEDGYVEHDKELFEELDGAQFRFASDSHMLGSILLILSKMGAFMAACIVIMVLLALTIKLFRKMYAVHQELPSMKVGVRRHHHKKKSTPVYEEEAAAVSVSAA